MKTFTTIAVIVIGLAAIVAQAKDRGFLIQVGHGSGNKLGCIVDESTKIGEVLEKCNIFELDGVKELLEGKTLRYSYDGSKLLDLDKTLEDYEIRGVKKAIEVSWGSVSIKEKIRTGIGSNPLVKKLRKSD